MTNATTQSNNQNNQPWRGIFFRGPEVVKSQKGREIPEWSVYQGDDQGKPAGRVYQLRDHQRAETLAQAMSNDRNLELINEAAAA